MRTRAAMVRISLVKLKGSGGLAGGRWWNACTHQDEVKDEGHEREEGGDEPGLDGDCVRNRCAQPFAWITARGTGCDLRRIILLIMLSVTGTPVLCFHCPARALGVISVHGLRTAEATPAEIETHQMLDEHGGDDDVRERGGHVPHDADEPVPPHLRERGLQHEGDRAAYPAH